MTLKEAEDYIRKNILLQFDYSEAGAIAKISMQHITRLSGAEYSLNYFAPLDEAILPEVQRFVSRLQWGEPVQYVTGTSHFYGFDFNVNPSVLIPRRETEELVGWILQDAGRNENLRIVDLCTGSGCIAITLKKFLPQSEVLAIDVSEAALNTAMQNALTLHAEIQWVKSDILMHDNLPVDGIQILVSNPPYVTEREKEQMQINVLNYEPHLALFVSDDDPLLFYRKISDLAQEHLSEGGFLYFEINEKYGAEIKKLVEELGFHSVELKTDMQGKMRMLKAVK